MGLPRHFGGNGTYARRRFARVPDQGLHRHEIDQPPEPGRTAKRQLQQRDTPGDKGADKGKLHGLMNDYDPDGTVFLSKVRRGLCT